ncbi:MAG: DUF58 domain-containing protein, partial [Gammaproteobacteria bacterium]|nr:DUF58 domain-containing protein [Gammaproteobacteria bacterium]
MLNILHNIFDKLTFHSDAVLTVISSDDLRVFFNKAVSSRSTRKQQLVSKDKLSGEKVSPYNGPGMDYSESRAYIAGDDIRHINWKQSAKTSSLISNIYHKENENIDYVLIDRRPAMYYGTQTQPKLALVIKLAMLSAITSIKNHKTVKIIDITSTINISDSIDSHEKVYLYFSSVSKKQITRSESNQKSLTNALKYLNNTRPSSCLVTIISDFNDIDKNNSSIINALSSNNLLKMFRVIDKIELAPPAVFPLNYKIIS